MLELPAAEEAQLFLHLDQLSAVWNPRSSGTAWHVRDASDSSGAASSGQSKRALDSRQQQQALLQKLLRRPPPAHARDLGNSGSGRQPAQELTQAAGQSGPAPEGPSTPHRESFVDVVALGAPSPQPAPAQPAPRQQQQRQAQRVLDCQAAHQQVHHDVRLFECEPRQQLLWSIAGRATSLSWQGARAEDAGRIIPAAPHITTAPAARPPPPAVTALVALPAKHRASLEWSRWAELQPELLSLILEQAGHCCGTARLLSQVCAGWQRGVATERSALRALHFSQLEWHAPAGCGQAGSGGQSGARAAHLPWLVHHAIKAGNVAATLVAARYLEGSCAGGATTPCSATSATAAATWYGSEPEAVPQQRASCGAARGAAAEAARLWARAAKAGHPEAQARRGVAAYLSGDSEEAHLLLSRAARQLEEAVEGSAQPPLLMSTAGCCRTLAQVCAAVCRQGPCDVRLMFGELSHPRCCCVGPAGRSHSRLPAPRRRRHARRRRSGRSLVSPGGALRLRGGQPRAGLAVLHGRLLIKPKLQITRKTSLHLPLGRHPHPLHLPFGCFGTPRCQRTVSVSLPSIVLHTRTVSTKCLALLQPQRAGAVVGRRALAVHACVVAAGGCSVAAGTHGCPADPCTIPVWSGSVLSLHKATKSASARGQHARGVTGPRTVSTLLHNPIALHVDRRRWPTPPPAADQRCRDAVMLKRVFGRSHVPEPDEQALLEPLRSNVGADLLAAFVGSSELPTSDAAGVDMLLLRYLHAEKRDVAKALARLQKQAAWRRGWGTVSEVNGWGVNGGGGQARASRCNTAGRCRRPVEATCGGHAGSHALFELRHWQPPTLSALAPTRACAAPRRPTYGRNCSWER